MQSSTEKHSRSTQHFWSEQNIKNSKEFFPLDLVLITAKLKSAATMDICSLDNAVSDSVEEQGSWPFKNIHPHGNYDNCSSLYSTTEAFQDL